MNNHETGGGVGERGRVRKRAYNRMEKRKERSPGEDSTTGQVVDILYFNAGV
jgi:hypothetical protein